MRIRLLAASLLLVPALLASRSAAGDPRDWLSLRRGPCFGNCPIYEVTLRADGRATYVGGDYAPRRGEYEGRVDSAAVRELLERLHDAAFWEMKEDRQLRVMDLPEAVLTAERRGQRHRVHTNLTPRELEPIFAAIDSVANELEWHPAQRERPTTVADR